MKKMVVLIGIPGAGKTTVRKTLFSSHEVVSFDNLPNRTRLAEDQALIKACKTGKDIVVDAANVDKLKRQKYIKHAQECGYEVYAVMVDTSLDAALARNDQRSRKVPAGVIRDYCEKLEFPSKDEGYATEPWILWNDWDPRRS